MQNRTNHFSKLLLCSLVALFYGCAPSTPDQEESPAKDLPNIVFILADDLGYGDLSFTGQTKFSTPNIDQLAKEGLFLSQHYSGSTVCAPSRSALLTGLHTGHTPIRGNKEVQPEGQWPIPDSSFLLPEALQQAGYVTGAFGKWGLGFPGSEGDPMQQGFDRFFGYNCQRIAHHYYPYHLWDNEEKKILTANADKATGIYGPNVIHQEALQFIETHQSKPFFLFYPSLIPHAELFAPEAYMEKYRGQFLPEKVYEGTDEGEAYRNGPYGSQTESHAAFAAMVNLLDDQVGEIVAKLETLGLTENTIIIFSSDNGPHIEGGADPDYFNSNGIYKGYKRDLYEGGIRVPTIVKWPGKISPGSKSNHLSAFWDFFPTLMDICQQETPPNLDGVSFLPTLLQQEGQTEHPYLYWEFHEKGGRKALRQGDWKLVQYGYKREPEGAMELYNILEDPGEKNDLAATYPDKLAALKELMVGARTEPSIEY